MQVVLLHKDINLIKALIGIFVQLRGTEYTVGLWFLPLLFITEILVYLIAVQNKKNSNCNNDIDCFNWLFLCKHF